MSASPIAIGLVGVGNCASSLLQGLAHYRSASDNAHIGLRYFDLGGYTPADIRIASAWDIDRRKVGRDVAEAVFAPPNCTQRFCDAVPPTGVTVEMAPPLDGVPQHMMSMPLDRRFDPADLPAPSMQDVVDRLAETRTEVLVNYLPVGSEQATAFFAESALRAGAAFVNAIPVFIASDPAWAARFADAGVPLIGDDIKAQVGATIVHRVLTDLFARRGVQLDRTYQLNTGGNTDFLNMLNRDRLKQKKISKTEAVQSVAAQRLSAENIHIGPSDYVAWQNDNKLCFLRMEGRGFGGVPMNLELRLAVEDSPNSAGVAIDMIRCARIARDRGIGGVIDAAASAYCKHPPHQMTDAAAAEAVDRFICGDA